MHKSKTNYIQHIWFRIPYSDRSRYKKGIIVENAVFYPQSVPLKNKRKKKALFSFYSS